MVRPGEKRLGKRERNAKMRKNLQNRYTREEDESLIRFLGEEVKLLKYPINEDEVLEKYLAQTGVERTVASIKYRLRGILVHTLHLSELPDDTKLRICFYFRLSLHPDLVERLEKTYEIQLNQQGKLVKCFGKSAWNSTDFSSALFVDEPVKQKPPKARRGWTLAANHSVAPQEDGALWKFVVEEAACRLEPVKSDDVWYKFLYASGSTRTAHAVRTRFHTKIAPFLHLADLDDDVILKIYYIFQQKVDPAFLDRTCDKWEIVMDSRERIEKFRKRKPEAFTAEEDSHLLKFLIDAAKSLQVPVDSVDDLLVGYKQMSGSTRSLITLKNRFEVGFVPLVDSMELSDEAKLSIYYIYQLAVPPEFEQKIADKGEMILDKDRKIQEFIGKDLV